MATRPSPELDQLRLRYASLRLDDDGSGAFTVSLKPSDPDLPFPVSHVAIRVTPGPAYPLAPAAFALLPGGAAGGAVQGALPDAVVALLDAEVSARLAAVTWPEGAPMMREALRWLEHRGLGEALRAVVQAQASAVLSAPGRAAPPPPPPPPPPPKQQHAAPASRSAAPAHAGRSTAPSTAASSVSSHAPAAARAVPQAIPPQAAGALPLPSLPEAPLRRAFAAQTSWQHAEQTAFERALAELFGERARSPLEAASWEEVAARVSRAGAAAASAAAAAQQQQQQCVVAPAPRLPEECAARYLALRRVSRDWLARSVHRAASDAGLAGNGALAARQRAWAAPPATQLHAAAAAAAAAAHGPTARSGFDEQRVPPEQVGGGGGGAVDMFGRAAEPVAALNAAKEEEEEEEEGAWPEDEDGDEEADEDVDEEDEEGGEGDEGEAEDEEEADDREEHGLIGVPAEQPQLLHIVLRPDRVGYEVLLERLSIVGMGTVASSRVLVLAQCERCATCLSASLQGAAFRKPGAAAAATAATAPASAASGALDELAFKQWCAKCSLLLSLSFRPTLVHEGSPSLGFVDTTHCAVTSLLQTSLLATCLECGAVAETGRFVAPATWEASCRSCFLRMRLDARVAHVELAAAAAVAAGGGGGGGGDGGGGGSGSGGGGATTLSGGAAAVVGARTPISAGRPLPERGTCAHYRHSYRWLRFPCCDAAFPCDECHDAVAGHEHAWAKRQICGHCSREQPFSNEPCVSCGGAVRRGHGGGGGGARHWEGGAGERNRELLSKSDAKKFRGLLKTKSAKAERVGDKRLRLLKRAPKTFERYRDGAVETVTVKPRAPGK